MTNFFARAYSIYAGILFILSFILIFPFILICIWVPGWQRLGRKINQHWAKVYFTFIFLPIEIENQAQLKKNQSYIFLANHFSYLDIPIMGFIPGDTMFVGKASIRKVPLFGYYFKKLHIAVDRSRLKSRAETLRRSGLALSKGTNVIIFPEGGIYSNNPPHMIPFKNGAFRLAIEKQIPIIPVTLSYNHLILPEDGKFLLHRRKAKIVFHREIYPSENETENSLKEKCFDLIQNQLLKDKKEDENRKKHH